MMRVAGVLAALGLVAGCGMFAATQRPTNGAPPQVAAPGITGQGAPPTGPSPAPTLSHRTRRALPSSAPAPALGVQYNGTWSTYTPATRTKVLDQLVAAGATWVRIDIGWATLEPHRGQYDTTWAVPMIDGVLRQAHDKGLKVLVTFRQAPSWANGSTNPNRPPRDPAQFARAAGWAAARWGSIVDAWEIWNEPNSPYYFPGTSPVTYTRLLCQSYTAVHAADPGTTVVFGGLMYNDDGWLRKAYAAGVHGCFDVLATHPFEGPSAAAPETPDDGTVWHLTHLPAVRAVMAKHGDGNKPVWFTEFGWSSQQPPNPQPWNTGVTQQQQAAYLTRAVAYTRKHYPYVPVMFWFRDTDQHTDNPHEDGYGLLTADLDPKPALSAFAAAARH